MKKHDLQIGLRLPNGAFLEEIIIGELYLIRKPGTGLMQSGGSRIFVLLRSRSHPVGARIFFRRSSSPHVHPAVRDRPDPVVWDRFCPGGRLHFEIICVKVRDMPAVHARAITRSTTVHVPYPDLCKRKPRVVPEFQEQFVTREHNNTGTGYFLIENGFVRSRK